MDPYEDALRPGSPRGRAAAALAASTDMEPVTGGVDVDIPVGILWKTFANPSQWPRWNDCVCWAKNHDLVEGDWLVWCFNPVRRNFLYRMPAFAEIIEVEENRRVTWEVSSALPGFFAHHTYSLEDLGGGRTRFGSWERACGETFRRMRRPWIAHLSRTHSRGARDVRSLSSKACSRRAARVVRSGMQDAERAVEDPRARRRRLVRSASRVLAVVAGLYVALFVAAGLGYRSILYLAPHDEGPPPPPGAVVRAFHAADGAPVQALYFPAPPGAPTLVHWHGNAETLRTERAFGAKLHALGLGVMLVEYRGYGASPGVPGEQAFYLDAEAVLDALDAEGVTPDRIVLSGFSLGTGVAVEMAARGRGGRLVLMAPFTSMPSVGRHFAPFLPTSILVRERFDTLGKAGRVHIPTLVIHGDADPIIPYGMGRAVAGAIAGAEMITVHGGHHNDLSTYRPDLIDLMVSDAKRARGGSAPP